MVWWHCPHCAAVSVGSGGGGAPVSPASSPEGPPSSPRPPAPPPGPPSAPQAPPPDDPAPRPFVPGRFQPLPPTAPPLPLLHAPKALATSRRQTNPCTLRALQGVLTLWTSGVPVQHAPYRYGAGVIHPLRADERTRCPCHVTTPQRDLQPGLRSRWIVVEGGPIDGDRAAPIPDATLKGCDSAAPFTHQKLLPTCNACLLPSVA